jgi:crotonobetainyl-CoA:carnitine CoA-transferase CaiB-like acyl-CoA transferase
VSGYGLVGPERDRASYDLGAFWARSGLSYQLASRGEPLNARGAMGDHITALSALAGVLQQRSTGEGCVVETSLFLTCLEADRHLRDVLLAIDREDLLTDEQVRVNDGLVEVPNPDGRGSTTSVNGPITFRGRPTRSVGVVPRLGEHADARFSE